MRFDTTVKFYSEEAEHYDPTVGDYVGGEQLVSQSSANVTDLGTDRTAALFGDVKQASKVIRLPHPVGIAWSYCLIGSNSQKYVQTTTREPLKAFTLIVGERDG